MNFKTLSPLFAPVELLDDRSQISFGQAVAGDRNNLYLKLETPTGGGLLIWFMRAI
jgi:hypothetical protein